jgi:hypothetical protein
MNNVSGITPDILHTEEHNLIHHLSQIIADTAASFVVCVGLRLLPLSWPELTCSGTVVTC